MKFEHSLKFNAVPEWQDNYANYPALKKVVYKLQQDQLGLAANMPQDGAFNVENKTTVSDLMAWGTTNVTQKESSQKETSSKDEKNNSVASNTLDIDNGSSSMAVSSGQPSRFHPSRLMKRLEKKPNPIAEETIEVEDDDDQEFSPALASFIRNMSDDAYADPESEKFDPLKAFSYHLMVEVQKVAKFYKEKLVKLDLDYENLIKDLESNRVNTNSVFNFTHAYNVDDKDAINTDEHHQYHIKSTLSRTTTNASVFDHINHVGNDVDDLEKQNVEEDEYDDDDDDDEEEEHDRQNSVLLHHTDFDIRQQKKITLKKRSLELFIELSELKSFVELNKIAFTKICKKFDKTCNYAIKSDFVNVFLPNNTEIFDDQTMMALDDKLAQIVKIYAFLGNNLTAKTTQQDLDNIRYELKSHLRDHIVWERNTVWKDLLSIEKKAYNLNMNTLASNKMGDEANGENDLMHLRMRSFKLPFTIGKWDHIKIPASILTTQILKLVITSITFAVLIRVKTFNDPVQGRCLAVLVAAAMLWALEALPLYVTAMLVPLLVVTCKVCKETGKDEPMDAPSASAYILSTMWSSVIMILIGGFTLAAALSKYNIAKVMSSYILAFAGTKPRNVLFSIMAISLFLAMWISNVASPVLCYSLIQPVLRTLPTDSPFARALVLGIALASNIAGMASPISSPQNVVALGAMSPNPGWGKWFAVALPVAIIALVLLWLELIFTFKIGSAKLKAYKPIKDRFTVKQLYISAVSIVTILLWCTMTQIEGTFGEAGIISVIPIVCFFGSGLLKVDDLNNFPWSIVWLAMGGIALGKAVTSSGLLATIAMALQKKIMNYNVFVILMIFGILVLVIATFVSHTVAALIIIPLVKEVGESLPQPHPSLLIMGTALVASVAMGLPTSGFPNVTAISMTDELGKPYLTVNIFISRGVPASIIAYLCVITVGYGVMTAINF